jgi:hypothetical protein
VLVLQGEADQVTSPDSTREFLRTVGASDKTLKTYPGALHNLIIDLVKDDVMRDMDTWIARRSPGRLRYRRRPNSRRIIRKRLMKSRYSANAPTMA